MLCCYACWNFIPGTVHCNVSGTLSYNLDWLNFLRYTGSGVFFLRSRSQGLRKPRRFVLQAGTCICSKTLPIDIPEMVFCLRTLFTLRASSQAFAYVPTLMFTEMDRSSTHTECSISVIDRQAMRPGIALSVVWTCFAILEPCFEALRWVLEVVHCALPPGDGRFAKCIRRATVYLHYCSFSSSVSWLCRPHRARPGDVLSCATGSLTLQLATGSLGRSAGYLQKKAKTGKWQKRWFETNAHYLTYYKVLLEPLIESCYHMELIRAYVGSS